MGLLQILIILGDQPQRPQFIETRQRWHMIWPCVCGSNKDVLANLYLHAS